MAIPVHLGLEHPSLVMLVVVGILAFVAGLGVNLYRSRNGKDSNPTAGTGDEQVE